MIGIHSLKKMTNSLWTNKKPAYLAITPTTPTPTPASPCLTILVLSPSQRLPTLPIPSLFSSLHRGSQICQHARPHEQSSTALDLRSLITGVEITQEPPTNKRNCLTSMLWVP